MQRKSSGLKCYSSNDSSKHHGNDDDDGKQEFLTGSRYSDNKEDDGVMTALESVDEELKRVQQMHQVCLYNYNRWRIDLNFVAAYMR